MERPYHFEAGILHTSGPFVLFVCCLFVYFSTRTLSITIVSLHFYGIDFFPLQKKELEEDFNASKDKENVSRNEITALKIEVHSKAKCTDL